jgi:hypothetical protein
MIRERFITQGNGLTYLHQWAGANSRIRLNHITQVLASLSRIQYQESSIPTPTLGVRLFSS